MQEDTVTLLCSANAAYAAPLAVMLTSAARNLKSAARLSIHVVESDISQQLRERIELSVQGNKADKLEVIFNWKRIDLDRFGYEPGLASGRYFLPRDCFSRLLAAEILPPSCTRAIYLDSDIVVLGDIGKLQSLINDESTISAATGVYWPYISSEHTPGRAVVFNYAELGLNERRPYFNSGVMVLNMNRWRERDIGAKALAYLEMHQDKIHLHDQGILNAILANEWFRLDQKWNQCSTILDPSIWKEPEYNRIQWKNTFLSSHIIHFDGPSKPWLSTARQPRMSYYYKYLKLTDFNKNVREPFLSRMEAVLGVTLYYRLWDIYRSVKSRLRRA
ncbi:MAG: glycosyltransferase family 8 protein [Rhizobiales bacterium]|nr:glycosyltransferase family 8 protein [Hyphomicrobiales bacterium]